MSNVYQCFKKALVLMLQHGELDKKFKHRRKVRKIKEFLEHVEANYTGGIEAAPLPMILHYIDDAEVLQTAIYYMANVVEPGSEDERQ